MTSTGTTSLIEPETVTALRGFPTTIIGDSQDRFGLPAGLRPMWDSPAFAGEAFTVLTAPGDNLGIHDALRSVRAGQVLVVDGGGYEGRALIGDLIVEKARSLQVAALVIDGAVRDVAEFAGLGVPVYARSVLPAGPWKNGPFRLAHPVVIGGVVVRPGDIVVGDGDGLAIITPERAAEVVTTCRAQLEREERTRAANRELSPNV